MAVLLALDGLAAAVESVRRASEPVAALIGLVLLLGVAAWLERYGTGRVPWLRRRGENLVATRTAEPELWLVAHLDSKSQPVPLLARAAAVVVAAAAWGIGVALTGAVASTGERAPGGLAHVAAAAFVVAAVAMLPLAGTWVGDRSPGALDNASGVATVIAAASQLGDEMRVGVLITSAEELGLAGARAWARGRRAGVALNVDGVDDVGQTVCVAHSRAGRTLRRALAAAEREAGRAPGIRRAVPGVLFDAVALAQQGWWAATVTRGSARSLARVHTAADSVDRWHGHGVPEVARVVAALACAMLPRRDTAGTSVPDDEDG